jgi:hypothetical protein
MLKNRTNRRAAERRVSAVILFLRELSSFLPFKLVGETEGEE